MPEEFTEAVSRLIRERRTINSFQPEPPPAELIVEAVATACWAPNHHRTEPWRFHLLGPESIQRVVHLNADLVAETKGAAAAEAKRERWSAVPGWLAVTCARIPDDPIREQEDYAACCCAVQNLALVLWSRGVGMKWTTGAVTRHPDYFSILGLDASENISVGMLWYGYFDSVPQQRRRPVTDVLRRLP